MQDQGVADTNCDDTGRMRHEDEPVDIAAPLCAGRGWIRFVGILLLIYGVILGVSVIGLLVAWIPLWLGVLLLRAADNATAAAERNDIRALRDYITNISGFFKIAGVVFIVSFCSGLLFAFLAMFLASVSGTAFASAVKPGIESMLDSAAAASFAANHGALRPTPASASRLPSDFPRTFIAEEDNGNYEAVLVERGDKTPNLPIVKDGKNYWEAYICMNEQCPGRAKTPDKKPYVFASVVPEMPPQSANPVGEPTMEYIHFEVFCPLCKEWQKNAPPQEKERIDPQNISRYMTPEAEAMINRLREEFRQKNR